MIRRWLVPFSVAACLAAGFAAQPATAAPSVRGESPAVTPGDIRFRHDVLRPGTAREAGLLPDRVAALPGIAASYLVPTADHPGRPAYAGASVLAAHHGIVVQRFAVGDAVRYAAAGGTVVELPPEQRIPARTDTMWDLASISKLFTTIVLLQQVEAGRVALDAPVARYVPEFAAGGKASVTVRHLLTHTSGLPAFRPFYSSYPTPETAARRGPRHPGRRRHHPRRAVRLLRHRADRARRADPAGHRQGPGRRGARRRHRAARHARHRLQPGPGAARPDRRDRVRAVREPRRGVGRGARRERVGAGRRGRARGGLLHRRRPGRPVPDAARRRDLPGPADPVRGDGPPGAGQLQRRHWRRASRTATAGSASNSPSTGTWTGWPRR